MQRILIVDDDPAVCARMIPIVQRVWPGALCTAAESLSQARAHLERGDFQLALVDIGLPDGSGIELIEWMQTNAPPTEAVIVSGQGDDRTIFRAIRAGAVGYLQKIGDDIEIEMSLASMQRGGAPIDPLVARRILRMVSASLSPASAPASVPANDEAQSRAAAQASLSERELEVLTLVSQGCSNAEIAARLFVSINTVECHAKNIYRKLAVRSRSAAVHAARANGLLG